MKNKILVILPLLLFISYGLVAQSFDDVLKAIEENNTEIQAGSKYLKSKTYEYKLNNLPSGPELSYGYFPDNSSVPGTKKVFEVSQSFQMPCFYRNQSAYSKLMINQEELRQQVLRQNILSETKSLLINYVYMMKQISVTNKRLKFAEDIYNAYMVRLETGDVNVLEVNKSKLHLLKIQKQEKDVRNNLLVVKEKLNNLNGGNNLKININDYPKAELVDMDSILFEKMLIDPEILLNQKFVEASVKHEKVIKNLQLPKFSLGYGSETVVNSRFRGVVVGLSIPLWSSKKQIQQVKFESDFYTLNNISLTKKRISETKIQLETVLSLKENLKSYETVLNSINNEYLLKESLKHGEISVIEFFTEMYYFYEIYDDFLSVEKDYYQSVAELYKYKL